MADWDTTMNDPRAVGDYYFAVVEKPRGAKRVAGGATGSGSATDPYVLRYVVDEDYANAVDSWKLEPMRTHNRPITIIVKLAGTEKKKIKPTVQDASGGGRGGRG